VVTALGLTMLVWWLGERLAILVDTPALRLWLWLLPPAMCIWGVGSALTYWSVRRGRFAINGMAYTLQFGSQAGGQLLLGVFSTGGPGLILGYLLGYSARTGYHAFRLPFSEWRLILAQHRSRALRSARESWRYPAFALPSQLLESACQLAPVILVGALYGPVTAGWYALGQRIMGLPIRVLAEAASQVFLGELRGLDHHGLHRLFLRTLTFFALLGIIGMFPIFLFAPDLFSLIFGEPWRETGIIVKFLTPLFFFRFVVTPISQILYFFNTQKFAFLSSIMNGIAMIGSFGFAYLQNLDMHTAVLIFSLSSAASLFLYLIFTWKLTHGMRLPAAAGREH
jgi:O-antigen/teichoic acid export membrane protein